MSDRRNDLPTGIAIGALATVLFAAATSLDPFSDWSRSDVLNLLVAIGTFSAALAATYVGIYGNKRADIRFNRELEIQSQEKRNSRRDILSTVTLDLFQSSANIVNFVQRNSWRLSQEEIGSWQRNVEALLGPTIRRLDIDHYAHLLVELSPKVAVEALPLRSRVELLQHLFDRIRSNPASITVGQGEVFSEHAMETVNYIRKFLASLHAIMEMKTEVDLNNLQQEIDDAKREYLMATGRDELGF